MTGKLIWALVFSAGKAAGGGTAFFLPERLWSNAKTMVIYKKGGNKDEVGTLKVGGQKEQNERAALSQNTESLLRVGENGLENISANYGNTQNNFFWMVGEYLKTQSQWRKDEMNKKGVENNHQGSLSIFMTDIKCSELQKDAKLKENSKVKVSCEAKKP